MTDALLAFAGSAWKEEAVRLLCAEAAAGKVPEDEAVGVHDSTSLALSTALRMLPTERPRADLGSAELAEFLEGKRAEAERGEEAGFLVSELHSATGDDMERAAVVSRTKICVPCCSDGLRFCFVRAGGGAAGQRVCGAGGGADGVPGGGVRGNRGCRGRGGQGRALIYLPRSASRL